MRKQSFSKAHNFSCESIQIVVLPSAVFSKQEVESLSA